MPAAGFAGKEVRRGEAGTRGGPGLPAGRPGPERGGSAGRTHQAPVDVRVRPFGRGRRVLCVADALADGGDAAEGSHGVVPRETGRRAPPTGRRRDKLVSARLRGFRRGRASAQAEEGGSPGDLLLTQVLASLFR